MTCSSSKSRQNCVFFALFFTGVAREEATATHAAIDATDDAPEALEAASSSSEGERRAEGFGGDYDDDDDDGSSLRPRLRPASTARRLLARILRSLLRHDDDVDTSLSGWVMTEIVDGDVHLYSRAVERQLLTAR